MLILSGLAIFVMALMTTVISGKKNVVYRADEYQLSSAVESVATLAIEALWSDYVAGQGGVAGDIKTFREFLVVTGVPDTFDPDDLAPPTAHEGVDLLAVANLPGIGVGDPEFNGVNVQTIRLVRRDLSVNATQLFVTVTATTGRGEGLLANPLNRAVQVVFTIEPKDFDGFEYAMLANNINCIFCHTSVDSVERYYNTDELAQGSFPRVKVGTLESLMVRHHMDGNTGPINDFDTDSLVAGTVYSRGSVVLHDGSNISDWGDLSFMAYGFDESGNIEEDDFDMSASAFSPAGDPPDPLENLYLEYTDVYADMVDGTLPLNFPAPIPDDGGVDPATGLPVASDAGNRLVDDFEFAASAQTADGAISGGVKNISALGDPIGDVSELGEAVINGNTVNVPSIVDGNVILLGSADVPLVIQGTVAINGDLIINGYIEGEGTLIVRGNVYIPSDLQYNDGREYLDGDSPGAPTGPRTFGISPEGDLNVLGLMAGGNIMIGDYMRPATLQWEDTWVPPGSTDTISGNPDTGDPAIDDWSFTLAEMSMFNRGEWAKTQPMLPATEAEAALDPSLWTAVNAGFVPPDGDGNAYLPRYYSHGEDSIVPIFNKGVWYDEVTATWHSTVEVPIGWDTEHLSYADPSDPNDVYLYSQTDGSAIAVRSSLSSSNDWMPQDLYKVALNYLQSDAIRPWGDPMSIDGLLYTNNAIFSLVNRATTFYGRLVVNGSLVAADIGMLSPGYPDPTNVTGTRSVLSDYAIGLQLNYDQRVKNRLVVRNPFQVELKRTLWNPTANML